MCCLCEQVEVQCCFLGYFSAEQSVLRRGYWWQQQRVSKCGIVQIVQGIKKELKQQERMGISDWKGWDKKRVRSVRRQMST